MIGKIFGINRIRFHDGPGITTLVGMYKCPLNCAYCINNPILNYAEYTIKELYETVKVDTLYFEATGGGICFGGHEPLLQQQFIKEFIIYIRDLGHTWKIGLETSLNYSVDTSLLELLDFIIVDIKSINSEIYREYTQMDNEIMLKNLRKIRNIPDVLIRIPIIPEYNDENDVEISKDYLRNLGFEKFDVFRYKTEE